MKLCRCFRLKIHITAFFQNSGGPLVQLVIGRTEPVAPHRRHSTAQKQVLGPCAVLPPALLQWNVSVLSLFYLLEPRIKVLVLGTGKKGIVVEVQDTPNACATFNFLSNEERLAAAGLIPPPVAG
uniref:Uncharacterized protein n=1 Tax=Sinocyclocheilus rhinocerous TaxID=307959 RepID=A0A673GH01_9TELE